MSSRVPPRATGGTPGLLAHVPVGAGLDDPGAVLDRFLDWVRTTGLTPYPSQEEALLELMAGRHVVLSTPTGSGKSLVALGLHFKALCEGRRSFYTAPIKALVSEKFFALCDALGPENVGMLTGDASINWAAPVVCCTAEVLSNMALRQGSATDAPYVVMDEFHYYDDRDRGVAWQVPLIALRDTTFLLMSATLGNTAVIEERLAAFTGRAVSHVHSDDRPVPLKFEYRDSPIHETVEQLLEAQRAPVYIVNFTQRECVEIGQALTSAKIASRQERRAIAEAMGDFRFDSPYGKELRRLLGHGVGIHHAGLLPKYRLLVEQLSQKGLLKVICGTDTLGVGVNIPIRTVLFAKLAKYDGEKVRLLRVRDFRQISGRAGRKGFDERGWVVCQAPEHVAWNKRAAEKERRKGGKGKPARKKSPPPGAVSWNRATFEGLATRAPETLASRFRVSHGMLLNLLQREPERTERGGGYGALGQLIARSHEDSPRKRRLRREAAVLFRSLHQAGLVRVANHRAQLEEELQRDFSLHQTLSLYLVDSVGLLDPAEPQYALSLLSLVEAVLENPRAILWQQVRKARDDLMARLKSERVPYEERLARLDEVTHPKPEADFIYATFNEFGRLHPWMSEENVRPKSIAREMVESYASFDTYVRLYGIQRMEGLLLRYLNQVYGTLARSVPDAAKTDEVHEVQAYLRSLIAHVDSSLLQEWESLLRPEAAAAARSGTAFEEPSSPPKLDLALTPKAFRARVRAEMHSLVRALAAGEFDEAAAWVWPEPADPWDAARFGEALVPFLSRYSRIAFDPAARRAHHTVLTPVEPRLWRVQQVLPDPDGDDFWCLDGEIDLREERDPDAPLVRLIDIHD